MKIELTFLFVMILSLVAVIAVVFGLFFQSLILITIGYGLCGLALLVLIVLVVIIRSLPKQ